MLAHAGLDPRPSTPNPDPRPCCRGHPGALMGNLLRALQAHGVAWRKASPFALKCRGMFPGVSSPSRQVSGECFWTS